MNPIITAQDAVLQGDTLVMLVKHQQVHLAMASPLPALRARLILCRMPVADSEVLGEVDDDDLAVLQDFNICPGCAAAFVADLRQGMLARVRASQLSTQPPQCVERLVYEANQLSLF
ncbi:hypothetical protein H8F21_15225 [Pseudomonas sp. P66]|uniref:Uncharacterized protein n=1 Tax=Pseudomonas arcuscaelestis TaxID=2710591 RepID=A0ABS2BZ83_9PSED|nr:hypothetical protein [Pseudomonas arcuscaelestis]MBM5458917.1 hypothetical protein [Pseudomonas arcuscaelestis]